MSFGRPLNIKRVDFKLINDWMNRCCEKHIKTCDVRSEDRRSGLKVINCTSQSVEISDPRLPYAALSYTWGKPHAVQERSSQGMISSAFQNAVLDAMLVALELGIPYLWVDRYCINQEDVQEKHRLISSMDKIYAGAKVTIIAAAGTDPDHGLPGVSSTPRNFDPFLADIGRTSFVPVPGKWGIKAASTWWARGWVFFQCQQMHCAESLLLNSQDLGYGPGGGPVLPMLLPHNGIGESAENIYDRLHEYTLRELSYEDDILNAFSGILNAYRTSETITGYLDHFWGIPILKTKDHASETATFLQGLLWVYGSQDDSYGTVFRRGWTPRSGTWPSWSWTSQVGRIWFSCNLGMPYKCQEGLTVTLTMLEGREMDIADYAVGNHDQGSFHPWINITSWTMRRSFSLKTAAQELNLLTSGGNSNTFLNFLGLDYKPQHKEEVDCMLVYMAMKGKEQNLVAGTLVIEEVTPGLWKRIGAGSLSMKNKARRELPTNVQELGVWLNAERKEGVPYMWELRTVRIV